MSDFWYGRDYSSIPATRRTASGRRGAAMPRPPATDRSLQLGAGVRIDHVVGEGDVGIAAALERDRLLSEMFEHLVDRLEPEVLNAALALFVYCHA